MPKELSRKKPIPSERKHITLEVGAEQESLDTKLLEEWQQKKLYVEFERHITRREAEIQRSKNTAFDQYNGTYKKVNEFTKELNIVPSENIEKILKILGKDNTRYAFKHLKSEMRVRNALLISGYYAIQFREVVGLLKKFGTYSALMAARFQKAYKDEFPGYNPTLRQGYELWRNFKNTLITGDTYIEALNPVEQKVIADETPLFLAIRKSRSLSAVDAISGADFWEEIELCGEGRIYGRPDTYIRYFNQDETRELQKMFPDNINMVTLMVNTPFLTRDIVYFRDGMYTGDSDLDPKTAKEMEEEDKSLAWQFIVGANLGLYKHLSQIERLPKEKLKELQLTEVPKSWLSKT